MDEKIWQSQKDKYDFEALYAYVFKFFKTTK